MTITDADLEWLSNNNTMVGPNAGRSIDPSKPGPDADRIVEIEREIAKLEAANEAAPEWGAAVGARWERIKGLRAELDVLRSARHKEDDAGSKELPSDAFTDLAIKLVTICLQNIEQKMPYDLMVGEVAANLAAAAQPDAEPDDALEWARQSMRRRERKATERAHAAQSDDTRPRVRSLEFRHGEDDVQSNAEQDRLAVCLMAIDECGEDDDPKSHIAFFDNYLAKHRNAEHSGDCRKEPWTCSRCVCDEYLEKARCLLSAFPDRSGK